MTETGRPAFPEEQRQAILAAYPLDREGLGEQLDRIASLAAQVCDAPIGLVSLVEADRQKFIGRCGTDLTGTPRNIAFCDLAMHLDDGMEIPDARLDPRFAANPLVTGSTSIRLYASHPLRSPEGAPLGTICIIDDKPRPEGLSDRQRENLQTLAEAAMALLERWRLDNASRRKAAESRSAIHDLEQRFQILADAMPQMVWSALPNGYSDYFNRGWCEFLGTPAEESHGDGWMRYLHPDDATPVAACWRQSVETGGVYEIEYRLRRSDGSYRWVIARGLPMRDEDGNVARWLGTCTDIQEQKAAAELQEVLTRELSHRIKNIFAVISGLIMLSLRRNPALTELGTDLQQRVLALGRAHDFVRPHSERSRSDTTHTSLRGMLGSLLAAYDTPAASSGPAPGGQRVAVIGEDVEIDDRSATPLALFFHELATNAAKYGAFTVAGGRVEIRISHEDGIVLDWSEHGGPPVRPAARQGFGGNLIEMSITRQLGGTLEYDWHPEGLRVRARIPASAMAR